MKGKFMEGIQTENFRPTLISMLHDFGLPDDTLLFVDDVERWCADNGIIKQDEYRPFRISKCLYSSDLNKYLIVFSKHITDDMISSSKGVIMDHLGYSYLAKINDKYKFLCHTMLHEIGHTKNLSEADSDTFAFEQLDKYCSRGT